jgi:hypothetical protein
MLPLSMFTNRKLSIRSWLYYYWFAANYFQFPIRCLQLYRYNLYVYENNFTDHIISIHASG